MAGANNTPAARPSIHYEHAQRQAQAGAGTGGVSRPLQNPLLAGALGDPSLNQNFGGGVIGGALQALQANKQHKAFEAQQQGLSDAMDRFSAAVKEAGNNPQIGLSNWLKENPRDFLIMHQAGLKPQELIQTFNAGQGGQLQQIPLPGGASLVLGMDPSGKGFHAVVQPHNPPNNRLGPSLGVDENNNVVAGTPQGGTQVLSGVRPTSLVNNQNTQAGANERAAAKASEPKWAHIPNVGWIDKNSIQPGQEPQVVPMKEPVAKLTPQQESHLSQAPLIYQHLQNLYGLIPQVSDPITGRVTTIAGNVFDANEWGAAFHNEKKFIENNYIDDRGTGGRVYGIKEKVGNLPSDVLGVKSQQGLAKGLLSDLQEGTGTVVASAEARGVLPDKIADSMAGMGVYGKKFTPALNTLRQNPDALTPEQVTNLAGVLPRLPKEDQTALANAYQKQLARSAQQATTPSAPALPAQQTPTTPSQPTPGGGSSLQGSIPIEAGSDENTIYSDPIK